MKCAFTPHVCRRRVSGHSTVWLGSVLQLLACSPAENAEATSGLWATGGPSSTSDPVASSGDSVADEGLSTDATSPAPGSSTDGSLDDSGFTSAADTGTDGGSSGATGVEDVPVDLPGFIDGVEPEAHANHPPMIDGNGNLYRVTETPADDGNNPKMMRSTDSGATWSEVDAGNRPEATDLEGCWQLQVGTSIYLSVANSDHVWVSVFNTSDAAERPDEWVSEEEVVPDLDNGGGVVQFSSLAHTSDGQIWLFHSGTMIDGRQQIGFRRRSASGVWSAGRSIGSTSGSWTGPRGVVGAGDVTHVFYTDFLAHRLYWHTLSVEGDLSAATRIDLAGTSDERVTHTNGVYYDVNGTEVIVLAYADDRDRLRAVTITDGEVDASQLIGPDRVLQDPNVAANDGAVAHLSLDGTTVHALWTDHGSGDILHSTHAHGGTWATPEVAWASGDDIAWWVYGNVYTRGGFRRLGFTYDIGEHPDDEGNIEYDEITLGP